MDQLPTFVHELMALIGEAAHPLLPHQGQGAGMAIEDAAYLTVILSDLKSVAEMPERLKLYNEARYERAHTVQQFSRLIGQHKKDRSARLDMVKYKAYNSGTTNGTFRHRSCVNGTGPSSHRATGVHPWRSDSCRSTTRSSRRASERNPIYYHHCIHKVQDLSHCFTEPLPTRPNRPELQES